MGTLRICLFGGVRISHDGQPPTAHVTRSVQSLLAYLALHRQRFHPREVLASVFWGEQSEERARSCLSTALWRLRGVLEPEGIPRGTYLVSTPMGEVGFNRGSNHWLDVAAFEKKVGTVLGKRVQEMEAGDAETLQDGLSLCTSELLEGFFDDWALRERERLRSLHLRGLAHLMRYKWDTGAYEESVACGKKILELDPLREEVHRAMMRLYVKSGQRALAIRHYQICCKVLEAELGIPPMEETQRLHRQILAGSGDFAGQIAPEQAEGESTGEETASLEQAFRKITQAMRHFEKTREHLQRAIRILGQIAGGRDRHRAK